MSSAAGAPRLGLAAWAARGSGDGPVIAKPIVRTRARPVDKRSARRGRAGGGRLGGVGTSGIGRYHGEHSFLSFSHEKGVVTSPTWFETGLTFPPYAGKLRWIRALLTRRFR